MSLTSSSNLRRRKGLHRLGAPFGQQMSNAVGRFNAFFSKMLGAYELISLNEQIPGMLQERQALRNRMAYRHKWIKIANQTVEDWAFKLPKDQAAKMSKLLFDEAESGRWMSTIHVNLNNLGSVCLFWICRLLAFVGFCKRRRRCTLKSEMT